MLQSLASFFFDGGIFMYAILASGVIGLAILIERTKLLLFNFNVDAHALWDRISRSIEDGHMEQAAGQCKDLRIPLLKILHNGISAARGDEKAVQNAIDEAVLEVMPSIDKRISYLATLANIATLLGLLGTIQGLIQAFSAVGSAEPSQKAELLAKGISVALYTTAFGLIVAIPLLIMYSLLTARAHKITDEIDEFSVKLINLIAKKKELLRQRHEPALPEPPKEHPKEHKEPPKHKPAQHPTEE
ncbi:MAG: MotA/TolQ/ExbB proton channel family protein [Deltaproteobacteria bacterium]